MVAVQQFLKPEALFWTQGSKFQKQDEIHSYNQGHNIEASKRRKIVLPGGWPIGQGCSF